jgi:hypothetical protein
MIRYLKHEEIDKSRWDFCIDKAFNGNIYAWSWYLDVVHPGWEALVDGDYDRVMPLTGGKKFGISYLYQPFFVQQLGVFSQKSLSPEIVESFLLHIPRKYRFAEIKLNIHNKFPENFEGIQMHRNFEMDLISDYDVLYKKYHTNTKRNLTKAKSFNLRINKRVSVDDIIALFRANRGMEVSKWKDSEYSRLRNLVMEAAFQEKVFMIGVEDEELIAGAVFMKSHDRLVFLFSGCNKRAKTKGAMTFLIDKVIHENSHDQLVLDFEGSDDDNLARFYQGFGSTEVDYPSYLMNHLPKIGDFMLNLWKKRRKA